MVHLKNDQPTPQIKLFNQNNSGGVNIPSMFICLQERTQSLKTPHHSDAWWLGHLRVSPAETHSCPIGASEPLPLRNAEPWMQDLDSLQTAWIRPRWMRPWLTKGWSGFVRYVRPVEYRWFFWFPLDCLRSLTDSVSLITNLHGLYSGTNFV